MSADFTTDADLARQIAAAAGEILMTLRGSRLFAGAALGAAGDRVANTFIMAALASQRPADAILSEEEANDTARCAASRVWIVDPLDGTREFAEGRADWAVHVALAVDGVAVAGAVALPAKGQMFASGARVPPPAANFPPRMVVSRSRPAPQTAAIAAALGAVIVPMGSAGAKAMAVVGGDADVYLHTGGQYEWDNCAPVAVALAHGLHASRIDGSPLVYNRADPYLPDLLICRTADAARIIALAAQG